MNYLKRFGIALAFFAAILAVIGAIVCAAIAWGPVAGFVALVIIASAIMALDGEL